MSDETRDEASTAAETETLADCTLSSKDLRGLQSSTGKHRWTYAAMLRLAAAKEDKAQRPLVDQKQDTTESNCRVPSLQRHISKALNRFELAKDTPVIA